MDKNKASKTRIVYLVLLVAFMAVLMYQFFNMNQPQTDELSTSEFVAAVNENRATEVTYSASSAVITGKYRLPETTDAAEPQSFRSTYVGEESLNELMAAHPSINYTVDVSSNNIWMSLITTLIPMVLIVGVFWFFMSQMQGANSKQMQFGKTKAKKALEERPNVKFSDVAGIDEAVEELQEIKDFLASPDKYQKMGAKIPHGVILVGPPGTGKTLLAKAVAGEAGVPFFSISGSDFVEMFVGVGASRVRDLFEQAKSSAPSIIFIDEIDAVGRQRGAGLGGGHDEREQTLNQLLVEMDGFEDHHSVILIAATNRVDILDPALLRPGRFDRQVVVDRPDVKGREQLLKVHSKGKPLASNIDMARLAQLTSGFTGADLANLMNESALLAARRNRKTITNDEVTEAIERVIAGPERKGRVITDTEKKTIAYHESGHALVGHLLKHADPVHKISIIARGQALGYTLSIPEEDRFLNTKNQMTDDLAMFLGGRVAEEIAMGDVTTGASNDLERATKMAKQMVTRYGMTDALGHQVYGEANHEVFLGRDYGSTPDYSDETANKIDVEVSKLMRQAYDVAAKILTENRAQLDLMANVLLERETVEGEAVVALLDNKWDEYLANEDKLAEKKRLAEEKVILEEGSNSSGLDGNGGEGGASGSDDANSSKKHSGGFGLHGLHLSGREKKSNSNADEIARRIRQESGEYSPFDPAQDGKPIDDSAFANQGMANANKGAGVGAGAGADVRADATSADACDKDHPTIEDSEFHDYPTIDDSQFKNNSKDENNNSN